MSYNALKNSVVAPQDKRVVLENFSGGICIDETNSVISDTQSPDMLNMWYDNNILCTRNGQKKLIDSAYHEKYFKNLFPYFVINFLVAMELSPTTSGVKFENSSGALKMTVPSSEQGFSFELKLERNRSYIFIAAVKNISRLRIKLKSDVREEASYYTESITKNADIFQIVSAGFTTGEYDISSGIIADSSGVSNNISYLKNMCIFDITDVDTNFSGASYLKNQVILDTGEIKSYETQFSQRDIVARGVERESYRHSDGSLSVVRSEGFLGRRFNGFLSETFCGNYFFHIDGSLYSWNARSDSILNLVRGNFLQITEKSLMFTFLSRLYIIDGSKYYCIKKNSENENGDVFFRVEQVQPYIPTVRINCNVNGVGDTYENYNLISRGYRATYNTKAGDTSFYLIDSEHYQNGFTVYLNGEKLIHSTNYTIYQTAQGYYIKLNTALTSDGINNLAIVSYIHESEYEENLKKIMKCKIAKSFGGTSIRGTRMFLSGNPDEPAKYFRSYIHNCTYFPDLEYEIVGTGTEKITAFESQYDALVVFTESSVYQILYSFDGETPLFSTKLISPIVGCDIPGSVHLVDNKLVFANTAGGVHLIDYFNGTDEKNIKQISLNINGSRLIQKGLLSESIDDLKNAFSTIFGGRYYLHTKNYTYVWDYGLRSFEFSNLYYDANSESAQRKLIWYMFNNIKATKFITMRSENLLAYASLNDVETGNSRINIVQFDPYSGDFGKPIEAYFTTKSFDFKTFMYKKILKWLAISSYSRFNLKKFLGGDEPAVETNGDESNTIVFGDIKVTCICDSIQQKSYLANINSPTSAKNFYNYYKIITSLKKGYHFAFKFESVDGPINISKVLITYSV